jgi:glutamyl-tRNA synthetase
MLDGSYVEGEVVVRVKTDIDHPNPAVRDWPAFRTIDVKKHPHPRTGSTFCVWPLFAFCCGIDDHELQITHVIRGKEHMTNSVRQSYLYKHLGWVEPEAVHYGRLRIIGTVLSKSKMKEGFAQGIYSGWDDPRLGTLAALRKRGFLPKTVRRLMVDVGPKPVDATISWVNVESMNRKLLDPIASRYFFVADPILMRVRGLTHPFSARLKLNPNDQKMGYRQMNIVPDAGEASVLVSKRDDELLTLGAQIRLMELFNIQVEARNDSILARFTGESYQEAREQKAPLIHWIPLGDAVPTKIIMPDATALKGLAESTCLKLKINDIIQFERFGFVRIHALSPEIVAYYAHR